MFSNPFRPLVALICIVVLLAGGAVAEARPLSKKERRKFDRTLKKLSRELRKDIAREAKELKARARRLQRDIKSGRLSGEEKDVELKRFCDDRRFFLFPGEDEEEGEPTDAGLASDATFEALGEALGTFDSSVLNEAFEVLPPTTDGALAFELRALRFRFGIEIDQLKDALENVEPDPEPEQKFEFQRAEESHSVTSQPSGTELEFVRPGIQRIEVTESGDVKIDVRVAFDEPDSFVRVELKRPDGTVFSTFDAQQKDSDNGESRRLQFEFTLDNLPAPGEPVLFTASSGFDQSFLSLVDPFDCLAFLFPGLVTPSTPSTPSTAKPE